MGKRRGGQTTFWSPSEGGEKMRSIVRVAVICIWITAFCVGVSSASSNRFFDFNSGRNTAGFFTSFTDDFSYFFGQVRTKPAGAFEVGLKGGVVEIQKGGIDATGTYLGLDGNFILARIEGSFPYDLYLTFGFSSILKSRRALNEFFLGPVVEKSLTTAAALTIRGNLGAEISGSGGSLTDDNEFDLFVVAGLNFNIGNEVNILMELKAGTDIAVGIGINFEF
jgi:hypothetical protein